MKSISLLPHRRNLIFAGWLAVLGLAGCQSATVTNQASPPNNSPNLLPEIADTDNDGVKDSEDKCLSTQPNFPVNRNGCVAEVEIGLGVRVTLHTIYPTGQIGLSPERQQEIELALSDLKTFRHQWVFIAGFEGKEEQNDKLTNQRMMWLKNSILQQDQKIDPNNILMYNCGNDSDLSTHVETSFAEQKLFDNVQLAQPHIYAFFTNMNQEFSKQNLLLQACKAI